MDAKTTRGFNVVEMREGHRDGKRWRYKQIAHELGISSQRAHQIYQTYRDRYRQHRRLTAEAERANLNRVTGASVLRLDLSVTAAEFSTWEVERIRLYFGGIAKMLNALKGG